MNFYYKFLPLKLHIPTPIHANTVVIPLSLVTTTTPNDFSKGTRSVARADSLFRSEMALVSLIHYDVAPEI